MDCHPAIPRRAVYFGDLVPAPDGRGARRIAGSDRHRIKTRLPIRGKVAIINDKSAPMIPMRKSPRAGSAE